MKTKTKPKPRRHPWDRWFARRRFTLSRAHNGKPPTLYQFTGQTTGMTIQIYTAAAKRGLRVSIKQRDERLVVDVVGRKR